MLNTFVVAKLCHWANWRAKKEQNGLGFPSKSSFAKSAGSTFWTPEMNSAAYEIDRCVSALTSDYREVIIRNYTESGTQEQKADRCRCHVRTYQNRLGMAHNYILGYLNDLAAGIDIPVHYELQNVKKIEMLQTVA